MLFCKALSHLLVCSSQLQPSLTFSTESLFHQTHSTGSGSPLLFKLTGCPSLDKAPASFDALLLESREVCCEKTKDLSRFCNLNVTTLDRARVSKGIQLGPESLKLWPLCEINKTHNVLKVLHQQHIQVYKV